MSEKTGTIWTAMAAIMRDATAIGKDSKNVQQGFNFRGIEAVMNHLHPIFAKHGVIVLPEVLEERAEERQTKSGGTLIYRVLRIKFNFVAEDGSAVSSVVIGEGMDSGDKAANKAMAVALKYALSQMLLLPYCEIDPDATTPEPSQGGGKAQAQQAQKMPAPEMQTPKQAQAPSASTPGPLALPADYREIGCTIHEVSTSKGEKNNKPWTRFEVVLNGDDTIKASTFDVRLGEACFALAGTGSKCLVRLRYRGKYIDIIGIENLDAPKEQTDAPSQDQPPDDLPF